MPVHTASGWGLPVPETSADSGYADRRGSAVGESVQPSASGQSCWPRCEATGGTLLPSALIPFDSNARVEPLVSLVNCMPLRSLAHALQGEKRLGAPLRGASASECVATQR